MGAAAAPDADIVTEKNARGSGVPVVPGETYDYNIRVRNAGPSQATSISITDPLPSALSFVSSISGCTAPSGYGATVTCPTITVLNVGEEQDFTFTVRLDPVYTGDGTDVGNVATAQALTPDSNPGNNSNSPGSDVPYGVALPSADLALTKTIPGAEDVPPGRHVRLPADGDQHGTLGLLRHPGRRHAARATVLRLRQHRHLHRRRAGDHLRGHDTAARRAAGIRHHGTAVAGLPGRGRGHRQHGDRVGGHERSRHRRQHGVGNRPAPQPTVTLSVSLTLTVSVCVSAWASVCVSVCAHAAVRPHRQAPPSDPSAVRAFAPPGTGALAPPGPDVLLARDRSARRTRTRCRPPAPKPSAGRSQPRASCSCSRSCSWPAGESRPPADRDRGDNIPIRTAIAAVAVKKAAKPGTATPAPAPVGLAIQEDGAQELVGSAQH